MNSPKEHDGAHGPELQGGVCELADNVKILSEVPVFSIIPLDRLRVFAYVGKQLCWQAGEFLFRQGEPDDHGYVMISGTVQVIREIRDRSILVNEFRQGDFFGGLALLSDMHRLFSARAVTDARCLVFDRESFRKLLVQFPELSLKIMDLMIKRVIESEERLFQAELSQHSSVNR